VLSNRHLIGLCLLAACARGSTDDSAGGDVPGGDRFVDGGVAPACEAQAPACSADLHRIVDCTGNVLQTCADDLGCANGQCVPACTAAAAAYGSAGCAFMGHVPDAFDSDLEPSHGDCYAVHVANTWSSDVKLSLSYAGQPLDASLYAAIPSGAGASLTYRRLAGGVLPKDQVAIVFLAGIAGARAACPIAPAVNDPALWAVGTRLVHAFTIDASAPVQAYSIYPYGGGLTALAGATLLLPTSAWGKNYVVVTPTAGKILPFGVGTTSSWFSVVASEDGTTVTVAPRVAIDGGDGVAAIAQGTVGTYVLGKGDVVRLESMTDLSSTTIQSSKPVGVFGGVTGMDLPSTSDHFMDADHDQLPPVSALGHAYAAVPHRDRYPEVTREAFLWRLVGAVDGTRLRYTAAPGKTVTTSAPTEIGAGDVADFESSDPFVVESQDADHPFFMGGYMTSCEHGGAGPPPNGPGPYDCRGDPEFVPMVPIEQYSASYVFFTDPTYSETELVLVQPAGPNGFADVKLDCLGTVTGFTAVTDKIRMARVDLVTGNFEQRGGCDNGRHSLTSAGPLGVTVWGWGSAATAASGFSTEAVSYAFPGGASFRPITTVVVPATPH
jgi:hypothetical protein